MDSARKDKNSANDPTLCGEIYWRFRPSFDGALLTPNPKNINCSPVVTPWKTNDS